MKDIYMWSIRILHIVYYTYTYNLLYNVLYYSTLRLKYYTYAYDILYMYYITILYPS